MMFRIHFLDIGQGDCTVLQFANGRTYLIDANVVSGKIQPLEYLIQTLGVTQLEMVIITHPHEDHISGLQSIIEQIPVRQIWLTESPYESRSYRTLLATIERRPEIRVIAPRSGMRVSEGKDRIYVLTPPPTLLRGTHSDVNNASIVLKVVITNPAEGTFTSAILGADAEFDSWASIALEHRWNLAADLLKVSHHGSRFGTYTDMLAAIRPKFAVISVGENPYGHPEAWVLEWLDEATSEQVFRTDENGTCLCQLPHLIQRIRWGLHENKLHLDVFAGITDFSLLFPIESGDFGADTFQRTSTKGRSPP